MNAKVTAQLTKRFSLVVGARVSKTGKVTITADIKRAKSRRSK